jgi:hypothetical protein
MLISEGFRVMVFNATFNNISVISWLSALLVEKTCSTLDLKIHKMSVNKFQCPLCIYFKTKQNIIIDSSLVEQVEEPAIYRASVYGFF